MKNIFYKIKYFLQRGSRGYAGCDLWDMDHYLADLISRMSKDLAKISHGHPTTITHKEWIKILKSISTGFRKYCEYENEIRNLAGYKKHLKKKRENLNKSFKLLCRWFESLWD